MTFQIQSRFERNLICGDVSVNESVLCEEDVATFSMKSIQVSSDLK